MNQSIRREDDQWSGHCIRCGATTTFTPDYHSNVLCCDVCSGTIRIVMCGCGRRTQSIKRVRALTAVYIEGMGYIKPLLCPDCGKVQITIPLPCPRSRFQQSPLNEHEVDSILNAQLSDGPRPRSTADYRMNYRILLANPGGAGVRVNSRGELEVAE